MSTSFVSKSTSDLASMIRSVAARADGVLVERLLKIADEYETISKASKLGDFLARRITQVAERRDVSESVVRGEMARAAGIDVGTVSDIVTGRIQNPPDNRLAGFARVLGTSVAALRRLIPSE